MSEVDRERAVGLLQELGLKEYEARCFVALTRMSSGTAKDVSELADVPRTRVYDAAEQLEADGLIETREANPKQFRGISIDEAADILRQRYLSRIEELIETVGRLETHEGVDEEGVWTLSGSEAIQNRTLRLVDSADEEVVILLRTDEIADDLLDRLSDAADRGVSVVVSATDEGIRRRLDEVVPDAEIREDWPAWMAEIDEHTGDLGRLVVVDRTSILISGLRDDGVEEAAIRSSGFGHGLVTLVRGLVTTGICRAD